ncbi:hypothetical protein Ga0100231_001470 [Opitutaceae bacterium TAV4]|nr:hypothetical protein Ga0100231_001470 [Opitutaceae bacterium TAV4]RRK01550.1 hypothetical protein Ga0100230_006715 [Opitutaceae bacterium TAV3]
MKKQILIQALRRLGELAAAEGSMVEITVYGGVAMMLHFDSRQATKDIDAIFRPRAETLTLARKVQAELDLPDNWINDEVRQFLSNELGARGARARVTPFALPTELREAPGLRISAPSPRYLIAMKARALRRPLPGIAGDREDLAVLFRHENIRSADEVDDILEEFFPDYILNDTARLVIEAIIEKAHAPS